MNDQLRHIEERRDQEQAERFWVILISFAVVVGIIIGFLISKLI